MISSSVWRSHAARRRRVLDLPLLHHRATLTGSRPRRRVRLSRVSRSAVGAGACRAVPRSCSAAARPSSRCSAVPAARLGAHPGRPRHRRGARNSATRAREVRAALGTPASTRSGSNPFGEFVQYRYRGGIRVIFQGKRTVTSVSTSGRGASAPRGTGGVGSSDARSAAAAARCDAPHETIEVYRVLEGELPSTPATRSWRAGAVIHIAGGREQRRKVRRGRRGHT